jgi:hypothetical protein
VEHAALGPIELRAAHEAFLESGSAPARVRTVVADSWLRSAAAGVDSDAGAPRLAIDRRELADYRASHPLSSVFPLLYDVLGRAAQDCDCVMAVGDAQGQLLWVCGQPDVLRKAEAINFVEGSVWDESRAGTNAPGTALRLDAPVQIHAAEHFSRVVQPWSCAAAPIHDPHTGTILGIVDVTGGEAVASPQTLAMIRAAARMAESELARLVGAPRRTAALGPRFWAPVAAHHTLRVQGLGRLECDIEFGGGELDGQRLRLSRRHSDILVALLENPDGLTGDQLAVDVYPEDVHPSTVRAEMTRLRALLGPDVLQSRPYRLTVDTECDWLAVSAQLAAGRIAEALRAYPGPLLPQSDAALVSVVRARTGRQLRSALLAGDAPELMVAWTRTRWGADDLAMWRRQVRLLAPSSPLRPTALAEVRRLEAELG